VFSGSLFSKKRDGFLSLTPVKPFFFEKPLKLLKGFAFFQSKLQAKHESSFASFLSRKEGFKNGFNSCD